MFDSSFLFFSITKLDPNIGITSIGCVSLYGAERQKKNQEKIKNRYATVVNAAMFFFSFFSRIIENSKENGKEYRTAKVKIEVIQGEKQFFFLRRKNLQMNGNRKKKKTNINSHLFFPYRFRYQILN